MNKYLNDVSFGAVAILLPIVVLLSSLELYAFNTDFYLEEFETNNIESVTKIKMEDLKLVTEKIIGYLKDKEDNLDIQVPIAGYLQEVFGKREKDHMVDVKILFQKGEQIRNIGLVLFLAAILYNLRFCKRKAYKSLQLSSIIGLSFVALLFILIQMDFYKYFTHFHEIFFTNDLWLLNPETDILIQMLPLSFFANISLSAVITFLGVMFFIGIFASYMLKKTGSLN